MYFHKMVSRIKKPRLRLEGVKFACDQCDYKARMKWNLSRHIKSLHEGIKFP